jgi:5'(3')-deoxyribonucleotidase
MQKLILEENSSSNYRMRTEENAKNADLTIAIALNFDTAGERLTKDLAQRNGKKYISIIPEGDPIEKAARVAEKINEFDLPQQFTLNIAGNSLHTIGEKMNQTQADEFTYLLLKCISQNPKLKSKIGSVRSGGQTGFDEAGAKAALKLGLTTIVHMPQGFKIRNQDGRDITMSLEHARLRFNIVQPKLIYIDMDGVLCDYRKNYIKHKEQFPEVVYPQSQYGFFLDLEPIPGSIEAFLKLSSIHDVWILTAPSFMNPLSYAEKNVWVRKYLGPEYVKRLIMCPNKSLMKGDYLIDDNEWSNWQGDFEGELLLIGSEKFPDLNSTLTFFESI